MTFVSANFSSVGGYKVPPPTRNPDGRPIYATAPTLVRTGAGDIPMAASGTIDLSNGPAMMLDPRDRPARAGAPGETQLGGAPVYTAGHIAQLGEHGARCRERADLRGRSGRQRDRQRPAGDGVAAAYGYGYKARQGQYAGILIADPVYVTGGGDISLVAGGRHPARRDTALEAELGGFGFNVSAAAAWSWIGTARSRGAPGRSARWSTPSSIRSCSRRAWAPSAAATSGHGRRRDFGPVDHRDQRPDHRLGGRWLERRRGGTALVTLGRRRCRGDRGRRHPRRAARCRLRPGSMIAGGSIGARRGR